MTVVATGRPRGAHLISALPAAPADRLASGLVIPDTARENHAIRR
ncbi:hypothetical protein [Amycolatopsis sp. FBCC-B4732]|nr:hypothetical protein [Amycolatopsis sp. FBCC-B4732]